MTLLHPNPPSWRRMLDADEHRRQVALEAYIRECEQAKRARAAARFWFGLALALGTGLAVRILLG